MAKSQRASSRFPMHKAVSEGVRKHRCRIMVLGIGGAGNNTVNRLVEGGLSGAEVVAINTDLHDLNSASVPRKVLIGERVTRGLSTCGNSELGRAAAEESRPCIEGMFEDIDVAFIAAGLGGGTGTGAAPVVAEVARRKGAVVVGVVTTPARAKGSQMRNVVWALHEMRKVCDTVVVVDDDKLMELAPQISMNEVFKVADQVLADTIKGFVETLMTPSLINLDFADFKTIMKKGGLAVLGVGESDTSNRAEEAVKNALRTTLLNANYAKAKGALVHVSGGASMTVEEVNKVGEIITETIGQNALVSWGARVNPQTERALKVTLVMTGMRSPYRLNRLVNLMPKLYDIESSFSESEKPPRIDLGLDQIENFED